jgi:hypothetical protein
MTTPAKHSEQTTGQHGEIQCLYQDQWPKVLSALGQLKVALSFLIPFIIAFAGWMILAPRSSGMSPDQVNSAIQPTRDRVTAVEKTQADHEARQAKSLEEIARSLGIIEGEMKQRR